MEIQDLFFHFPAKDVPAPYEPALQQCFSNSQHLIPNTFSYKKSPILKLRMGLLSVLVGSMTWSEAYTVLVSPL